MGGDLKHVHHGRGELRIVEIKKEPKPGETRPSPATLTQDEGYVKVVSNTRGDVINAEANEGVPSIISRLAPPPKVDSKDVVRVAGTKIVRANTIGGTGVDYIKGHQGVAVLKVKDGLWEQKRGHKVDGGERRRAEVRSKRAAAERKAAR